jgi:DDE superfamily endonuclease
MWVIPPAHSGEFVAHMEDGLDVYQLPYDPQVPMVCMDEQPVQLIKETRQPLPPAPGQPEKVDYEYERNGTANIFLFTEPLHGTRHVRVTTQRTAVDWANEIRDLLEVRYPDAVRVRLVCDNLNIHGMGSLYEAFPPEQAHRLASRLEIHHTPKHGSGLNIAESELSALTMPCRLSWQMKSLMAPTWLASFGDNDNPARTKRDTRLAQCGVEALDVHGFPRHPTFKL